MVYITLLMTVATPALANIISRDGYGSCMFQFHKTDFFVLLEYILKSFSFRREVTPAVFHNKNTFNLAVTELNKERFYQTFPFVH